MQRPPLLRYATGGGERPARRGSVAPDRVAAGPGRRNRVGDRGVQSQADPATGRAVSQRAEHGNAFFTEAPICFACLTWPGLPLLAPTPDPTADARDPR